MWSWWYRFLSTFVCVCVRAMWLIMYKGKKPPVRIDLYILPLRWTCFGETKRTWRGACKKRFQNHHWPSSFSFMFAVLFALLFHEVCIRSCFVWIQNLLHPYPSLLLRVSHSFHWSESLKSSLVQVATLFQSKSMKNEKEQSHFPNYE